MLSAVLLAAFMSVVSFGSAAQAQSISIDDISVTEGGVATFTVSLDVSGVTDITVDYTFTGGTATAGSDFTGIPGTITWLAGDNTPQTITVTTNDDSLIELPETFTVDLSNASGGATISKSQGVCTINDNEQASITINDVTVNENAGSAVFIVTLSAAAENPVSVDYATADGTATAGSDYTATSGNLTIPAGTTTGTISVPINDDSLVELAETFDLKLSGPSANATITNNQGQATINSDDTVSISINDMSVSENAGNAVFTVTLSAPAPAPITVDYTTTDGTATAAGGDYTTTFGTLPIPAGSTTGTISVPIIDDAAVELAENFFVDLSNASALATIGDSQGECTITPDDTVSISIDNVTVTEGGGIATFTVSLSAAAASDVTVQYATSDGTAVAGPTGDYLANSGTLTISTGNTSATIDITVNDDSRIEPAETFFVNLSNQSPNATIAVNQGKATIQIDELASISINDIVVNESDLTANFTVSIPLVAEDDITVQYFTMDGSAMDGTDYTGVILGTVTIPAGSLSATLSIPIINDADVEPAEDFSVFLFGQSANATIDHDQGSAQINSDDLAAITIDDITVNENVGNAVFTVTLSAAAGGDITVDYATQNETATAGSDYTATSGTLTILAGSTTGSISVPVINDLDVEPAETFLVNLTNASALGSIIDGQGQATINVDDKASVTIGDITVNENVGNAVFTVTLSAAAGAPITVDYATQDDTAAAGSDYTATSGTLTIAAGSATGTISVPVINDTVVELAETFFVNLTNASALATISDNQGQATINADDKASITINDIAVNENAGNAVFTVTISPVAASPVSVDYATADGTAAAGSDYTATSGTLTIAAGNATGTISVPIINDTLVEPAETFVVNLTNASPNAAISDSQGQATINIDDKTSITIDDITVAEDVGSATFTVTLSVAATSPVTVQYATADGAAKAPGDYTAKSGTLTIPPGSTTGDILVTIINDTKAEATERFYVNLSSPSANATISDNQGQCTITDNVKAHITINNPTVAENAGTAIFTVTLSLQAADDVTVNYATSNGTATAGSDYTATSGTLTIAAGETTGTISVPILEDSLVEPAETFNLTLSSASANAIIDDPQGVCTISIDDKASISINDIVVNENVGNATFTVTLSSSATSNITVNYATANGTAVAPGDYTTKSGTLTITAGNTTGTITVAVNNDTLIELAETFFVNLSNPSALATISDNQGQATINVDEKTNITINDITVNENAGNAVFTVTLSAAAADAVTVQYATANNTATSGSDYTATSGTLTIPAGSTTGSISVPIINDTAIELAETFFVNLSSPSAQANITDSQGIGTINVDEKTTITINDITVNENAGNAVFTVTINPVAQSAVSVNYATANGTATAGSDYTATSGTLSIAAGSTTGTISVPIIDDTAVENAETFVVNLSGASDNATIGDTQGQATISIDDKAQITINDISVNENAGNAIFTVTLSATAPAAVTVNYATANNTATSGSDYTATSGTLSIAAGSTTGTISVPIINDTLIELPETFYVNLSSPSALGNIADSQGICTINVDEQASITINDVTVNENAGNANFTVTLSAAAANAVIVQYATSNGTATSGSDYTATSGTLTIAAGSTTGTISVPIINDATIELAETFFVNLSSPSAQANITDNQGQATINVDEQASITINDMTVNENAGNAVFTVTLSAAAADAVTVQYATANGTATSGSDYTATSGTLSIPAGSTTGTISVAIINDTLIELAETFFVNLSSPSANALITDNQGQGTINVDEKANITINDVSVSEAGSNAVFSVTLSGAATFNVTIDYTTADNTATAGSDFTTTGGTLTIAAGSTTGTISVPIINDYMREGDETFYVNLSNAQPSAALNITDNQGLGTIMDNEFRLTVVKAGTAADGYCNIIASVGSATGLGGGSGLSFYADYDSTDTVTLTAYDTYNDPLPAAGSVFKGWSGGASGTSYTTTVAMTSDKTVTATFNATHILSIDKTGTGAGRASVTSGAGSDPRFPGGSAFGTYLYEQGSTVSLTGTDNMPTAAVTGSEFQNWTVQFGDPGAGFSATNKNTSVTISGDLSILGNFIGKYMITSFARTGGNITPLGSVIKYHGENQAYSMAASAGFVLSDRVVDGFSQGAAQSTYTFDNITANHSIIAVYQSGTQVFVGQAAGDEQIYQASVPPMVLMVMGRDHKLYYEAYNDSSDLNGDGTLDVGYNPAIDYYGYFDSDKAYLYGTIPGTSIKGFYPVGPATNKKVSRGSGQWSGDFLNYLTMSRMDALRKVLYGGYRVVDTNDNTVLERVYIPQDAHSWGKEYHSEARDGYHISDYTPFDLPAPDTRHLFASTSLGDNDGKPRLRVLTDSMYRIWDWVSIERPVAGTRCLDGGSGPNCETAAVAGGGHPGHPANHAEMETLVSRFGDPDVTPTSPPRANELGRGSIAQINGTGNPHGGQSTNYLTIFKGELWIKTAARYQFGVDGANAVEVLIDGVYRANAGWYNDHNKNGSPGSQSTGWIYLAAGKHSVEFRQEYGTYNGPGSYYLSWRKENPSGWGHTIMPAATFSGVPSVATLTNNGGLYNLYYYVYDLTINRPASRFQPYPRPADDPNGYGYEVRVQVGVNSGSVTPESNCKRYPNGTYKPTGLLQKFGEPGKLNFGLLTGTYEKNLSGGVLRKKISPISDEINSNTGQFITPASGGIINTINKMRISQFRYSDYAYQPGAGGNWNACDNGAWITCRPINEGEMKDWGNPIAEMMYEGLRYFAGKTSATSAFDYSSGVDVTLGLPKVASWDDPFITNGYCAKAFMLVLSDINPSYDSNQLPGVFSTFGSGLTPALNSSDASPVAFDAQNMAEAISAAEGIGGSHYIGQVNTTTDSSCSPKNMTGHGFGRTRGLCPEEPTKQGSYYSPAVAHFGRTHDISASTDMQEVLTYVVGLASPLPRLEIRASNNRLVTLVPFGKSVGGCLGISPTASFQPTNTIVDFYIESLTPTSGMFRVNFEDVEQGADHDMDAIVVYRYQLLNDAEEPVSNPADGTKLRVSLLSEYAAGCIIQHIGFIISGTTQDGTYLDVLDVDTAPGSDVDFFLDTPPGVYAGGDYRHMPTALPYSSDRVFTVGNTTAATLLKDPLWYAAKWGGFLDQNNNNLPDLQSEWDADGDGEPDTYFYVVNPLKLEQQLNRTFSDIVSRGVSHVAPVVSVDEANRTQSGDKLYMAFFKPMSDNYWQGNLKKYGLDYRARTDCGRTFKEWTVVDQFTTDSSTAETSGNCDGTFKPSSRSFWSTVNDGGYVDRGGVGEKLRERMPGNTSDPVPTAPYYDWRNIFTYINGVNGALERFIPTSTAITNEMLEVSDQRTRYRIFNYIYGYTYDAGPGDFAPQAKREWILGDIIHSEPKIIDYLDSAGNLIHRFIAVGANDGMLHVFTDSAITLGGVSYEAGDEIFAFIPKDLLRRLKEFSLLDKHTYMVDGSPALYRKQKTDGTYEMTLIFGERSGGRSYWALDVSQPNPSEWKVKWHIEGGKTEGFEELGYTWSKPFFAKIKTGTNTSKEVVLFAGGYDPIEDGFPEGFDDQNQNGKWDTNETHGVTLGGTEGYDKWNPGMNTMGRGIFVLDLADGSKVFTASYGAEEATTGTEQKYSMMKYCFPADISLIPLSDSLIMIYAADVYGQIWRIRYDYVNDAGTWTVRRVFTANPGSTLASGDASAFAAGTHSLNAGDAGRKMFYSPDVSLMGNDWTSSPVLYVGTGDRQHARYTMVSNRMYFVSDTGTVADETKLLNLTCDELDDDSPDDPQGSKAALRNILTTGTNGVRGFYRALDKQGNCAGDNLNHTGEHILSQPTLFFKNVFFTSYQPVFADPCNPVGNAFIYALDYSFGASAFNYDLSNDTTEGDVRTLKDTYRFISGSSIPSGVRIIMRDGHAAGLISAGGAVAGIGEQGTTAIPGPPGGITPLLWETE